jgi:hypothetical protein
MSNRAWIAVKQALRSARPLWWIAGTALAYAGLRIVVALATGTQGLFTPSGPPSIGLLVLGLGVLGLRLALLFVVPTLLAYLVVGRLLERIVRAPRR